MHIGTFILNPNGAFSYIQDGTFSPEMDYFVYQLNDGEDNAVETDTVYISIVNPPPVAVANYYAVYEGKQLVVDSIQGLLIGTFSPLGFAMKAYIDQPPSNGVILPAGDVNTNGSFVYEHDCSDTPSQDFFTFTVVDSVGRSDPPDTVYITINNVCPNGNNDDYTVTEGEIIDISLGFGVLANDIDDNPCDPLTVNLVTPPLYHNGGFVLNSDGSFIYSHDDSENFVDQFSYRLSDGECAGAVYTVTITIDPVDDKPPIANNDLIATCVDEGGSFTISVYGKGVLGNDIDPDVKDSILTAILVDPPMHGDLIFNSDGTFTYTHDDGDAIADAFTYICNDGDFNSLDTATVSICINPINDCPVAEDDYFLINEGDVLDSSLVFNDSDPDTFEKDFFITTVVTPPAIGTLELKSDGTFKYFSPSQVPLPGPEVVTFVYKLSDGTCEVTANVTITINSINDCPIAEDDTITVNALDYDTIIKDLIMNDHDIDSFLDSTSIEIINPPHWGDYIVNGDGTISYMYTGSPTKRDSLTYWVRDSEGCYSNQATLLIYIENLQFPKYQLPDYFTPNNDRFNDYFVIKLRHITLENVKFEVMILDRYQRKVFESTVTGDIIWDGMNQFTGGSVKKGFYYYQITPIEFVNTKARTIVGVLLLDK
jgi:gliding motility-associated-like protein